MDNLPVVTNQLEFLFLKRLVAGLKDGTLDLPTAKVLTQTFRHIEPFSSVEDAKAKMQDFSEKNPYFSQLQDYIDAYYSEQYKDVLIEQIRDHVRQGNIDQALQIAKN